jgi:hypothetical protein
MRDHRSVKLLVSALTMTVTAALVYLRPVDDTELPNRIPEPAPYVTAEAQFVSPPFEEYWQTSDNPGQCQSCHARIFSEWNGSMMANAWRDPAWRAAFLLSARETSTSGACETPDPPDGSAKAQHNPFASATECASVFDLGTTRHRLSRSGSLLDGMCSRCHMPTNYVDNVPLRNVTIDVPSGMEHGTLDPRFDPTSPNDTGLAFATVESQLRNTDSGKSGIACMICHADAATRDTPFHNHRRTAKDVEYPPALGTAARASIVAPAARDILDVPEPTFGNLGYSIGGGSFRLSPHAIGSPERLGPLTSTKPSGKTDRYLADVFKQPAPYEEMNRGKHEGYRQVLSTRAEFCSECHDVTNPLTIKNKVGKWVGGFPIERTYAEWSNSRYADRPGNRNYDPAFKRDCQTCHMQQDYGRPGTAHTLYTGGAPAPPLTDPVATDGAPRTYFSHHFVGGNTYVPRLIGSDTDDLGNVQPYPELSAFSFSSADEKSVYANAFWTNVERRGTLTQQARLAWDRLRNVLDLDVTGPRHTVPDARVPLTVTVTNSGSGHNFPTGFPEGRIAWVAVRAFDVATGHELAIQDSFWKRTSIGVGRLTREDTIDPNFPGCNWNLPAGSPDPYAYQFKAVASQGDGCPTLDLVYAAPLNLVTNAKGLPIDASGKVVGRANPSGLPQFVDLNHNGDLFDDAYLRDTRLRPLPNAGATLTLDRYSVVVPADVVGPIAVSAAVYYQSIEAIVAKKFLGNLADTDLDFVLEPCVLGGACDGRTPSTEPAAVEGAPPVPMRVRNWMIHIDGGASDRVAPRVTTYPASGATDVHQDVVVKAFFSRPVRGVTRATFTLVDAKGAAVPAAVDQIGDGTWALFPDRVFLEPGATYTARLAGVCDEAGHCTQAAVWRFRVSHTRGGGSGDTTVPIGFGREQAPPRRAPVVTTVGLADGDHVVARFSQPVMNVTPVTFRVRIGNDARGCAAPGAAVAGTVSSNLTGDAWTFTPTSSSDARDYCITITDAVYDLAGQSLRRGDWHLRRERSH